MCKEPPPVGCWNPSGRSQGLRVGRAGHRGPCVPGREAELARVDSRKQTGTGSDSFAWITEVALN